MARKRPPSRPQRWQEAIDQARAALDELEDVKGRLEEALEGLREVRDEYAAWRDNLPENLANGGLAEKLDTIVNLELDVELDTSEIESAVDEAEGAELPLGFGRD